jgi:hypothetical protein
VGEAAVLSRREGRKESLELEMELEERVKRKREFMTECIL